MKKRILILILVSVSFALWTQTSPIQDRSSKEYFEWKKNHDMELSRAKVFQQKLLSDQFSFNALQFIEVSPGEKYYSWWGHCLLRLVGSGENGPESDLAISFLADFNDFPLNKVKAGLWGYEVWVKVDTIEQYRKEYIAKENRSMDFYQLNSTEMQRLKLLDTLRLWIINPKSPGSYSFFFLNCVGLLNKLLFESGILPESGFYGYFTKNLKTEYKKVGVLGDQLK